MFSSRYISTRTPRAHSARLASWLIAIFVSVAAGCSDNRPAAPLNVVFVLVDTLRADHTSLHGYSRSTTPFLDEVARESVVFDRARSQAGCTYPSVNTMLTSRFAFDFYGRHPGTMRIPSKYPTLAEILVSRGYSTAAVSASPIVRATPSKHNPEGGFDRGFDIFDELCLWKPAACVNRQAERTLTAMTEPFFLYLHYMDPHGPYRPPNSFASRFAGEYEGHDFIAAGDPRPVAEMLYADGPEYEIDGADFRHLVDLYDDEILYFDHALRALVDGLRTSGVLDRTLLIVTSDHGEEFFEHGHIGHCRGVWDTLTHIPLLIRVPGIAGGRRVSQAVQGVDLAPTILDVLGVNAVGLQFEGVSLEPLLNGAASPRRLAYSDQSRYRSVDDGILQLILDGRSMALSVIDLETKESRPIERDDRTEVETLRLALHEWLDRTGQGRRLDTAMLASEAQEEQLRALGYLE